MDQEPLRVLPKKTKASLAKRYLDTLYRDGYKVIRLWGYKKEVVSYKNEERQDGERAPLRVRLVPAMSVDSAVLCASPSFGN